MEFKEYSEFTNPEISDYDLYVTNNNEELQYQLLDLIGILSDGEWEQYGITREEYMNPTIEVIEKVKNNLNIEEKTRSK